jgi:pyruvate/2-oxoglutarate dehydrogenase complex dihydrolipoamide acyltransferase (E2) component
MYTVKKIEEPDRGILYAVCNGDNDKEIIGRYTDEEEAKEACTNLNGGEAAEKKLEAAEKKAEEDAKKAAADHKPAAKPAAPKHEDEHKPRAHTARAKQYVKRMTPKPTRRHK